jgi:L-amino acid N-acyltransferase YncA
MAADADAAAIAAIYGPYCESTAVSFETVPPSTEEIANRIRNTTVQFPWLVLQDDGVVAGYAYATRHRDRAAYGWSVDTAVYVSPTHRRRGVGRALYATLFHLLRAQGYFKAYAGITLPNAGSIGLHEATGFAPVGVYEGVGYKHGAWHDVAWYHLRLQPERDNPAAPSPVSALAPRRWADAAEQGLRHYQRA